MTTWTDSFFYIAFPTHAALGLDWNVTDTGVYFAVLSLCMVVVQGPVLARLSKRLSETALVSGGGLILAAGFVLLLWPAMPVLYCAAALIALGNGLMWPTFTAVLSKQAGETFQGAVQGFASSLGAAASIVGLIGGGLLYTWIGPWVFVLSAAIIAVAAVLSIDSGRSEMAAAEPA